MCECSPGSTPRENLVLLAAWATHNPGCVPTCARCGEPFDLRNASQALTPTERESIRVDWQGMIEDHDFMVGQNFFADEPYSILPECSCGWEGQGTSTVEDAQEQWENHCDVVFMEATTSGRNSQEER